MIPRGNPCRYKENKRRSDQLVILLQMQALIQLSPQLVFNRIYKANKTTTTVSLDSLPCVLVSSIKKTLYKDSPLNRRGSVIVQRLRMVGKTPTGKLEDRYLLT